MTNSLIWISKLVVLFEILSPLIVIIKDRCNKNPICGFYDEGTDKSIIGTYKNMKSDAKTVE